MRRPVNSKQLRDMRANRQKPVGGVVITDSIPVARRAQAKDFLVLTLPEYSAYDFTGVAGLTVFLIIVPRCAKFFEEKPDVVF